MSPLGKFILENCSECSRNLSIELETLHDTCPSSMRALLSYAKLIGIDVYTFGIKVNA